MSRWRAALARRRGHRLRPARLAVLAALLAVATPPGPAPGPVGGLAADQWANGSVSVANSAPTAAVRMVLDELSPAVPRPGGTLRVAGRLQNTGSDGLTDLSVLLRLGRAPVLSRGQLADLAAVDAGAPDATVDLADLSAVEVSRVPLADLAPGGTAEFAITVGLDELGLGGLAVHPLAVEAQGSSTLGFGSVGAVRTFLPWAPDPVQALPTRLVWLWPLADRPRRAPDGTFLDDGLARDLDTGGRLARLVAAAGQRPGSTGVPVTWVLDPLLLEDAAAMTGGYRVAAAEPGAAGGAEPAGPGTGDEAARRFLGAVRTVTAGDPVVVLPYADPDLVPARRAALGPVLSDAVVRGQRTAAGLLDRAVPGAVARPPDGYVDPPTARLLARAGARALVLRSDAQPLLAPLTYTPTGRSRVGIGNGRSIQTVLVDPVLSAVAAASTQRAGTGVLARQRFLAETAMITAERPGEQRTVAVLPPTRWAPTGEHAAALLDLTASAPWLSPATLPDLLALPAGPLPRAGLTYPPEAASAELPSNHLTAVREIRDAVDTAVVLLDSRPAGSGDSAGAPAATPASPPRGEQPAPTTGTGPAAAALRERYTAAAQRLLSAGLRGAEPAREALLARTRAGVGAVLDGVRVLPTTVQLSSREQSFPVTVENDLAEAVTVQVVLTDDSPRLALDVPEPVTVEAGGKRQVLVPAQAVANGLVRVTAHLQTVDGRAFGEPALIQVRVAQYGPVALLVTAGAAVLLAAAAGRNVYRRIRAARAAPGTPAAGAGRPPGPGPGG